MFIVGELINCTRKKIGAAAAARDAATIQEVALKQDAAGAHMLDVNGGIPGQEVEVLSWLVDVVQQVVDLPLCLDSSDPDALRAALPHCRQPAMVNSITDEADRFDRVMPLLKEHDAKVIGLAMGPSGPPSGIEDRVENATRLIDHLTSEGMALDDIYVDPCVLPVSTGPVHGIAVAEAITRITERYPGVHTAVGLSNVSFGLPLRKLLNQTFLALLMSRGLDTIIMDPADKQLKAVLLAGEALLGHDEYCMGYLRAYRKGLLDLPGFPPAKPQAAPGSAVPASARMPEQSVTPAQG